MTAPHFRSAKQLAADIRRRRIGCLEALDLFLARGDRFNPQLNAIIATDVDVARRRARQADAALRKGKVWGPLHGVPMTVKESYDVVGMPTTWGLSELKGNMPPRNALAVDRLLGAGVVLFGKTNVPSWLADWQSYNPVYGTTNNPWDSPHAGRLSGGSAAALAAGLTGFEAGSDIGASIRQRRHYSASMATSPTYGWRSRAGPVSRVAQGESGDRADCGSAGRLVAAGDGGALMRSTGWAGRAGRRGGKAPRDSKVAAMRSDRAPRWTRRR